MGIEQMKERISTLEKLIEKQSDIYVQGYYKALTDNGLLLDDVPFDDLSDEYKSQLYSKVFTWSS